MNSLKRWIKHIFLLPNFRIILSVAFLGFFFVITGSVYIIKNLISPNGLNFILISIDTLRADHLGCYGYSRNTSPNIDELAKKAIVFKNCTATSSWTLPSHASMLTGLYPISHGAIQTQSKLDDETLTLAEVLKEEGYTTAGFVSGHYVKSLFGLHQGFDLYLEKYMTSRKGVTSAKISEAALSWLKKNFKKRFFLFIHYFDVHHDYVPPPPYDTLFDQHYKGKMTGKIYYTKESHVSKKDLEYITALYDGEIRWVDSNIGRLMRELKELGLEDRTVIILTSDHGDEFLEHGLKGHCNNLYETVVHVPLIIKTPSIKGPIVREDSVSSVDIFPTMLGLAKIKANVESDGVDIVHAQNTRRAVFSELSHKSYIYQIDRNQKSIRIQDQKMIFDLLEDRQEFYDLKDDPRELNDLMESNLAEHGEARKRLMERFFKWSRERGGKKRNATEVKLDVETKKQLKSLGYL